jgi:imidazole glycerol-phosphate synthase subunit HisH
MDYTNIKIVDYGMGNIQSVKNAFEHLNCSVEITDDPNDLKNADGLILPGVGAFGQAMFNLKDKNLISPLKDAVLESNIPILGICLGMQLLSDKSDERGSNRGLSLIPGEICKIPDLKDYRLPHVGWSNVEIKNKAPLFTSIADNSCFYFVHSYRFMCDPKYIAATAEYGHSINAVVQNGHIFGVQFHPEKSQRKGFHLINNFIEYVKNRHMEF